jgi:hypothetical protein
MSAGLYAVFPWVAAMVTMEVVYCTVQSVIYCCVVYFACGEQLIPLFRCINWFFIVLINVSSVLCIPHFGVSMCPASFRALSFSFVKQHW